VKKLLSIILNFLLLSCPAVLVWAAEPGEKTEAVRPLVPPEELAKLGGLNKFFAETFNADPNHIYYAILVTIIMGLMGAIIAFITDIFLKMAGMDVSKIDHHE
jgi:hypothetical protein